MIEVTWQLIGMIVFGYLMGSVSSAIILSKMMGLPDPRTQGSGNPGATNMMRTGGKKVAALTLVGDMIKGALPVLIGMALGFEQKLLIIIGFAAFIGHLYPVFFGFRGGKGVATALGVLLASSWIPGLLTAATWGLIALVFRISSLSAVIAFALSPVYAWLLNADMVFVGVLSLLSVLLIWRHRSNIQRLLAGTEGK